MFSAVIKKGAYFLKSLSFSVRLALSTFMVSMLTLLILSGFLKYVLLHSMENEYKVNLNNHISEMQDLLRDRYERPSALSKSISDKWIEAELENWPYFTRLIDSRGNILGESENMPFSMEDMLRLIPAEQEETHSNDSKNHHYLLIRKAVYSGPVFLGQVQVARDLQAEEFSRQKLDEAFISMTVFGGILTVLLTLLISRKTLKPLVRMRQSIESIGVNSLNLRVGKSPWPKELRPIAVSFDKLLDELQDNFDRLSHFSSDLAHELRTPVHKLMVETDVILSSPRSAEEYRRTLENLQEAVHDTAKMLEDMLFIARAENKFAAIKPIKIDAEAEVAKLADFLQIMLEEKELKFALNVKGTLEADRNMFLRALSNLINNAVRHSPKGGVIEIEGKVKGNSFIISVADSGQGIAQKDLHHIFERFFKADSSRPAGAHEGNGLGLAIVKSVMVMHGGAAAAHNKNGGGAVFVLTFPLKH